MNLATVRIIIIAAFWLASVVGAYLNGCRTTDTAWQARHNKELATANAQATAAEQHARQVERDAVQRINTIEQTHHDETERAQAAYDSLLDDYRAGAVRLRDRFTCPPERPGLPDPAASPARNHAVTAGGLQRADAEFLVSEAKRADEVTRQLQACQAVLEADRIP